eukprot:CAMPEP_0184865132 /NCGR_PEP_ID=MMETSP0580-20130426/17070_1 /TAXON_ID=1118495 /ORGANISM="Dactyliosolen fragilissimus" /LENGTH=435 /DNA_ID=CAMNT_0027364203 /DNA_START=690 /DNA_END=1997 /DNA_ORIENTATION=-
MVTSLYGSSLGLALQGFAIHSNWSIRAFLCSRVLTGCFAGSSPVAKAFLADLVTNFGKKSSENNKKRLEQDTQSKTKQPEGKSNSQNDTLSRYLAWRDASSTLAYILGPALGGLLFQMKKSHLIPLLPNSSSMHAIKSALSFVIGISAIASFLAATLIATMVNTEQNKKNNHGVVSEKESSSCSSSSKENINDVDDDQSPKTDTSDFSVDNDFEMIACPLGSSLYTGIATVCIISFLYHVADSTFFAFFPALLQNLIGFDARSIGLSFTAFASISFLFSASSFSSNLIRKFGVVRTCVAGLCGISSGLFLLSTAAARISVTGISSIGFDLMKILIFGAAGLYFCGVPLYGPTIPTMLLQCVPPHQRGAVMGIDGAINTIARIATPLIMGDIYRRKGIAMVFGLAGGSAFVSAFIATFRRIVIAHESSGKEMSSKI